ncbi:MAG: DUF3159 domain-containing protein, partial [Anaerolineales bacterium]
MDRRRELVEELRVVFAGRGAGLFDSIFPLLVFLIANALWGLNLAVWGSIGAAGIISVIRLLRREPLRFALAGLGGVAVAALFVKISGSEAGFFFPGFISGAVTVLLCIVSVALRRPLVAWTSFVVRRWPLDWYWHPRVLPAYNEVTLIWAGVFAARLGFEFWLYQRGSLDALGVLKIILGWPLIVILLIGTY